MTKVPQVPNENDAPALLTPQQSRERQERLAKALRENLLKRKEQMRARLIQMEAALNQNYEKDSEVV
ncbi:hypothetical protein [Candidatus Bealeia paramacronuclearis]|uniref:hypothetical protein n=1 Tax=Candidatus Bealeia paramacronuclearis TaxID=1921001 RepID=UPI002F25FEC5